MLSLTPGLEIAAVNRLICVSAFTEGARNVLVPSGENGTSL